MAQVKGAGHVVSSSERSCDTLVNGIRVEDCLMQILTHNAMCLIAQASPTLCDPMDCSPPGLSVHGDSPDKNTGKGCHALLQGIFPTQGWNPGLLHCRQIIV